VKFLRDTWMVFNRSLGQSLRNPIWVIIGLTQPIMYLFLFGPLLKPIAKLPQFGGTNQYTVFIPGLIVQLGMFGSSFVGFAIIAELRAGVIERQRVSPLNRTALLVGRSMRDVVVIIVQAALLVLASLPLGLKVDAIGGVVAIGLVALMALALSAMSYATGLKLKNEDALAPLVNFVVVPLMLLSGLLLPITLDNGWLRKISAIDPLRFTVDAARSLFKGDILNAVVGKGFAVTAALALVCLYVAVRQFRTTQA
jgi:ABC-2 type transport system permease protein